MGNRRTSEGEVLDEEKKNTSKGKDWSKSKVLIIKPGYISKSQFNERVQHGRDVDISV